MVIAETIFENINCQAKIRKQSKKFSMVASFQENLKNLVVQLNFCAMLFSLSNSVSYKTQYMNFE